MTEAECRRKIITTYAGWTALSALKAGVHIKSRADIYPLLEQVNFAEVLTGGGPAIRVEDFAEWHRRAVEGIRKARPELVVGWAAKLVNVYLPGAWSRKQSVSAARDHDRLHVNPIRQSNPATASAFSCPIIEGQNAQLSDNRAGFHPRVVRAALACFPQ